MVSALLSWLKFRWFAIRTTTFPFFISSVFSNFSQSPRFCPCRYKHYFPLLRTILIFFINTWNIHALTQMPFLIIYLFLLNKMNNKASHGKRVRDVHNDVFILMVTAHCYQWTKGKRIVRKRDRRSSLEPQRKKLQSHARNDCTSQITKNLHFESVAQGPFCIATNRIETSFEFSTERSFFVLKSWMTGSVLLMTTINFLTMQRAHWIPTN